VITALSPSRQPSPTATGWPLKKVKYLAVRIGSGKTPRGGNQVYVENGILFIRSMNVYDDGLRLDDVAFIDEATDEEMAHTRVRPADVLLNITGASIGRTCIVPEPFQKANVNQHVCIIRLRQGVNASFVSYALKSTPVKDQIRALENGSSREGLNYEQVGNLLIQLPDALDEQGAVVAFLDRKTAEIDAVIAAKERMLGLLQEKRQVVISQAVTQGLNPSVPSKDSGFPWLGPVPAHWAVERLKFRFRNIEQGWSPQCENSQAEPGEWGVLKVGCMNSGVYDESENKALPAALNPVPELEVRTGDVLMSRSNTVELVGMVGIVHRTQGRILLCDKLYRIGFRPDALMPEYAVYLLRSQAARLQIERDASGASPSMKNISTETVGNLLLPFPPLDEQRRILAHIHGEWDRIDRTVNTITEQVAKLREYRQTLISAAVTGTIDVRKEADP